MASQPPRKEDFQIAIICALPVEYDAVKLIFDEFWSKDKEPQRNLSEGSGYMETGRTGNDNAILCLLPCRGEVSAAMTVTRLISTYTELRLAILAGIYSGVPSPRTDNEILLGDVVIGKSVAPFDISRNYLGGYSRNYTLEDGPDRGTRAISAMSKSPFGLIDLRVRTFKMFEQLQKTEAGHRTYYHRPAADEDVLFEASYPHRHRESSDCIFNEGITCAEASTASCKELQCDMRRQVLRKRLRYGRRQRLGEKENITGTPESRIHIGRVASGDFTMKIGRTTKQDCQKAWRHCLREGGSRCTG
ncbi:hypothetical protein LZ31DRAFT_548931 [Colletotrichum somersetense]|nr:hypothetical protein LZ31DRAFT_548931 [Colletotrichum somersetense]